MGRETRILLGLLGLLAGLFVGVLSLKLLVPRPPAGAGPDVHGDVAFQVPQEIVAPPTPGPRVWGAGVPPPQLVATVVPLPPTDSPQADQSADRDDLGSAPEFAIDPPATLTERAAAPATVDPFVAAAGWHQPTDTPTATTLAQDDATDALAGASADTQAASGVIPASRFSRFEPAEVETASPAAFRAPVADATAAEAWPGVGGEPAFEPAAPAEEVAPVTGSRTFWPPQEPTADAVAVAAGPIAGSHVVATGDSWWSVAERAYGDGRLYRALFAWNRALDPRIALAPGTSLQVPPREQLEAAWPKLLPLGR